MRTFYSLIVLLLLSLGGLVGNVFAQIRLQYPIPDLGYCRDAKECSLYCEIPENKAACWSYGKYKVGSDVLGVTTMSEEEKRMMETKAKQYNVTFPIADLDGCAGPQECRDFCQQPANQTTCIAFAKKKGLDKEMKREELLTQARTELGCTSMESCSKVCESDQSRCESFARKHGVYQEPPSQGRSSSEKKQQLMQRAQSELGCTSMESCKSTCEQNPQACMAFAKKHGFKKGPERRTDSPNLGTQRFGKGNCDSEESCKKYCQEHPDECPGFGGYTKATQGGSPSTSQTQQQSQGGYMSPSGCRTEGECESWCEANPDKCPGFSEAKTREETTKREYELKKKSLENQQGLQQQQYQPTTNTLQEYNYRSSGGYQGSGGTNTLPAAP